MTPGAALAVVIAIVIATAIGGYRWASISIGESIERELAGAAHLKADQIERWLEERQRDVHVVTDTPLFTAGMRGWLDGIHDPALKEQLIGHLTRGFAAARYSNYCLRSAEDGAPLPLLDCHADSPQLRAMAMAAARRTEPLLEEFHRNEADVSTVEIGLLIPVVLDHLPRRTIVAHISLSPAISLFPAMQQWPGSSPSAEVLLVRRDGNDVVFLNTLRFGDHPPLSLRLPTSNERLLANQLIRGDRDLLSGYDYRGVKSVGYGLPVTGTSWFLMAKMDYADAYAWLDRLSVAILGLAFFMLLLTGWWWRERQQMMISQQRERDEAEAVLARTVKDLADAQRIAKIGSWETSLVTLRNDCSAELREVTGCGGCPPCGWNELIGVFAPEARKTFETTLDEARITRVFPDLELELEPDGNGRRWVHLRAEIRCDEAGQAVSLHGTMQDITERKALEEERERQSAQLAELSGRLISTQEDERRRLSAELHDRTSANLAALDINLRTLARCLPAGRNGQAALLLDDSIALLADTNDSLREVCADLRPPVLDYAGLLPALQSYGHQYSMRSGVDVAVECHDESVRLDPQIESTLFRIAQEALTNCAKHAEASRVCINLRVSDHMVAMDIEDDGKGFPDDDREELAGGLGLLSMRERAQFLGGHLIIVSGPGTGTRISASIPVYGGRPRIIERRRKNSQAPHPPLAEALAMNVSGT